MDELQVRERLGSLDFVSEVFVGRCTKDSERKVIGSDIWCDEPFTAVVKNDYGQPAGLIGFHFSKETLYVGQLQGVKRAKLHGVDLGPFFIEKAEVIARAMGKSVVRIIPAQQTPYWDIRDDHDMYPKLYAYKNRLKKIYNIAPSQLGYSEPLLAWHWWEKTIRHPRKRLTFARWLKLMELRFKRKTR